MGPHLHVHPLPQRLPGAGAAPGILPVPGRRAQALEALSEHRGQAVCQLHLPYVLSGDV